MPLMDSWSALKLARELVVLLEHMAVPGPSRHVQ